MFKSQWTGVPVQFHRGGTAVSPKQNYSVTEAEEQFHWGETKTTLTGGECGPVKFYIS